MSSYLFVSYSSILYSVFNEHILKQHTVLFQWWAQVDSNHRPRAYQARALTTWAMSPFSFRCISFSRTVSSIYIVGHYVRARFVDLGCRHCRPGGDDGNRTHDPLLAGQVLSQLSYTPIYGVIPLSERSLKIEQQAKKHSALRVLISPSFFGFGLSEYERSMTLSLSLMFSIERRWSSRTFRYGYLVTT